jgi:hypothetical protein
MSARGAALDRKEAGSPAGKPRRTGKSSARAAPKRNSPPPGDQAGAWARSWRAGIVAMLLAGLAAGIGVHLAGHAPSWRSLTVIALQSLPLLPGMTLFWRAMEWLKARRSSLPMALWLGIVFLGAIATMLAACGIAFAVHNRVLAFGEDHDGQMQLIHHLMGVAGALYLYLTTAFRLWWPFGVAVPAVMSLMFWQAHRR